MQGRPRAERAQPTAMQPVPAEGRARRGASTHRSTALGAPATDVVAPKLQEATADEPQCRGARARPRRLPHGMSGQRASTSERLPGAHTPDVLSCRTWPAQRHASSCGCPAGVYLDAAGARGAAHAARMGGLKQ